MNLKINECQFCPKPGTIQLSIKANESGLVITKKTLWLCDKHMMNIVQLFNLTDMNGNIGSNFNLDISNLDNEEE